MDKDEQAPEVKTTADEIGRMVNAAVASKLEKAVAKAIAGLDIGAQIKSAMAESVPKEAPEEKKGEGKLEAQIKRLAEELEGQRKATAGAEEARKKSESDRSLDLARNAFKSQIAGAVKPELLEFAAEHFGGKLISLGEDGKPVFSVRKAPYTGAPEEDMLVPLDEGVKHFLASQTAQPFLPAPGGQAKGAPIQRGAFSSQGQPNGSAGGMSDQQIADSLAKQGFDISSILGS
jgi:hypothetical protein